MARRICLIGEVMVELSGIDCRARTARVGVAGDTYNTAVHLARLLPAADWTVEYVTLLGQDALSDQIVDNMRAEGISTRLVGRHPHRLPGLYAIELDARGERSFRYWRDSSAARRLFSDGEPVLDCLDGAAAVFLSLITLAILPETVRAALIGKLGTLKDAGTLVAFDSNFRPALWPDAETAGRVATGMWRATTLALPSRDDEARLSPGETTDACLGRLAGYGVREIALKNGANGPILWSGQLLAAGPFQAAAVVTDTTGAGDAFNAAYLAARLTGADPAEAALRAHGMAVKIVAQHGAIPPE